MLEKRYVAGKLTYRVPGALVWSYSRTHAIERAKQGKAGCLRSALASQALSQITLRHYAN
jgi:hypothetical protein